MIITWLSAAALAQPVAVIGLGDAPEAAPVVAAARRALAREGRTVLTDAELREGLSGVAEPWRPDEVGLAELIDDAARSDSHFDTPGANALRAQVLRAFAAAVRPTPKVRELAARAAQDTAAALLGEGQHDAALAAARDALLGFDVPLDANRHGRAVFALFEQARRSLAAGKHGALRVVTRRPGTVLVEGLSWGAAGEEVTRRLPVGRYRVWLITPDGAMGLPHRVDLSEQGSTVTLDPDFDRRLSLEPVVTLRCDACAEELAALGSRAGVSTVFGVGEGKGVRVDVASGMAGAWEVAGDDSAASAGRMAKFRPLYLVPFGVGQFAQDRPVYGGAYAAAQVGLLAWHVTVVVRHRATDGHESSGREPELREQRNLSAMLLYTALAASVIEAVVVGVLRGEGVVVP